MCLHEFTQSMKRLVERELAGKRAPLGWVGIYWTPELLTCTICSFPFLLAQGALRNKQRKRFLHVTVRTVLRFCFNCYQHQPLVVIHGAKGKTVIISSQEGVTQGDPLSMICYGIGPFYSHAQK